MSWSRWWKHCLDVQATRQRNAMCNTTHTNNYASQPATTTANGCVIGTYSDATDIDGTWKWTCIGQSGGTNAACTAARQQNASCASTPSSYATQPATNLSNGCSVGSSYTDLSDDTTGVTAWKWQCNGWNTGANAACTAAPTYTWIQGGFGSCNNSTAMKTQTVICQSAVGNTSVSSDTTSPLTYVATDNGIYWSNSSSLSRINDGDISTDGTNDYQLHPPNAIGKTITMTFATPTVIQNAQFYNRTSCCSDRIGGAKMIFKKLPRNNIIYIYIP